MLGSLLPLVCVVTDLGVGNIHEAPGAVGTAWRSQTEVLGKRGAPGQGRSWVLALAGPQQVHGEG